MRRTHAKPNRFASAWKRLRRRRWLFRLSGAAVIVVVLLVIIFGSIAIWPDLGAKGTAAMRVVIGDRATAKIEGAMLSAQDWFHQVEYSLGMGHNDNPLAAAPVVVQTSTSTTVGVTSTTTQVAGTDAPPAEPTTTTTTEAAFQPAALAPMGSLQNEGQWQPYVTDQNQRVVAYRAVLQPDPGRGYAHAVVVAVDLTHARLHFVLGYEEPVSSNRFDRPGVIPAQDLQAGILLGAFNGGFQAKHGHFGAMADGQVALPAIDGLGTLVIYQDGRVAMGAWGADILPSADMQSMRQNGPLMVTHGEINPHTATFDPSAWGYVFGGGVATFRSGVGLSQDGNTLFYVIGPSLTTQSMAAAMRQAGVWNGMQLDINRPWTRFDKAVFTNGKLTIEPAVDGIAQRDRRLFEHYMRDFFYLTAI